MNLWHWKVFMLQSEGHGGKHIHCKNWPVLARHSVLQEVTNVLVFIDSWTALEWC